MFLAQPKEQRDNKMFSLHTSQKLRPKQLLCPFGNLLAKHLCAAAAEIS